MKKYIYIIATIFATMATVNNAQAQEVAQADSVKTSAINAASVIGTANSKGCFHGWVDNGYIHVENCNGFYAAAVAGYSHVSYKNNEGNGSAGAGKFGIQAGYRTGMLRPELAFYYTTPFTVEGREYSAPELQVALNIDFNRHSVVDFYIAPTVGYKFVQSQKAVELTESTVTIPYDGNALMLGGKAGAMIKVGNPSHKKAVVTGNRKVTYYNHSQLFIKIEANYQFGQVSKPAGDKLTMNEAYANIGLVWKW